MDPIAALGQQLRAAGYQFVTSTPETHRRVLARGGPARDLRDVFGFSKPYTEGIVPPAMESLLKAAGQLQREGQLNKSGLRYSSLYSMLFAHSAYPTLSADSVFFGPDTYRYAALLKARVERAGNVADVGAGSGAGGLSLTPRADSVQLLDINPAALLLARANAELNGLSARVAHSDVLSGAEGPLDLVIANPPYLVDEGARVYRDGGGPRGTALSLRIVREALERLAPGGRLLLYTATPVIEGAHALWPALLPLLRNTRHEYWELDPDVFGEELERPAYADVERIAVVALDAWKR